jgi:hypothetical protein
LFGRTVPALEPVGRVPLGRRRRGANQIRWSGKVGGRRLAPGTYQITLRTFRRRRLTDLSLPVAVEVH